MPLVIDLSCLAFIVIVLAIDIRYNKSILDSERSNMLKGICAVIIFCHHLTQRTNGYMFINFGYLGVSGFLFIFGYGLMKSYSKNQEYYKKILFVKIPKLVLLLGFSISLTYSFRKLFYNDVSINDILFALKGNVLLNWYFPQCVCLYVLFAVSHLISKRISIRFRIVLASLLMVLFIIQFLLVRNKTIGIWWLYSYWSFLLGICISDYEIVYAEKKRSNIDFGVAYKFMAIIIFMALFFISWYLKTILPFRIRGLLLFVFLSASLFSIILYWCGKSFRSLGLLTYIGSISAELLLAQTISLEVFRSNTIHVSSVYIYTFLSCLLQIIITMFYVYINNKITKVNLKV